MASGRRPHVQDAQADGRAVRWMIVVGGPGLALTDFGESETAEPGFGFGDGGSADPVRADLVESFGYTPARGGWKAITGPVAGWVRGKQVELSDIRIGFTSQPWTTVCRRPVRRVWQTP